MDLRYPIGEYEPQPFSEALKQQWIGDIRFLPNHIEKAILNLDANQLETSYRENGWTVLQVVHHVADSHINAYCRFKLALTEDEPTIKPYDQDKWAELPDVKNIPVNISVTLLFALHARWVELLDPFEHADWEKTIFHPEHKMKFTLWYLLGSYAWHSRHHVAQIVTLRERMNWK